MATNRRKIMRNRRGNIQNLTGPQLDSLLHGHDFFQDAFKDDAERREAWELHRADLMAYWLQDLDEWLSAGNVNRFGHPSPDGPGTRPAAWWNYDAPAEPLEGETEVEYLHRLKLLTAAEKRHLAKHPELLEPEAVIFEDEDAEEDEPAACAPP